MEAIQIIPPRAGQICKILIPDEDSEGIYIFLEDPTPFDEEDEIYVID